MFAYRHVDDFLQHWEEESTKSLQIFRALSDTSLETRVDVQGRSIADLAWHIVQSQAEMLERTGLEVDTSSLDHDPPAYAAEYVVALERSAESVAEAVRSAWRDADLRDDINMYGTNWKKGTILAVLIDHEIHHRGQLTVLMRQAGLRVPGIYGPAREEWAAMGMPAPR